MQPEANDTSRPCPVSARWAIPAQRHHISQKVRIGRHRTLYLSVHDDAQPAEVFLRLKGPDCTSELIGLYDLISRSMRITQQDSPSLEKIRNRLSKAKPAYSASPWTSSVGWKQLEEPPMHHETATTTPMRPTGNVARVRRYRAGHRRIDYAPGPDVLRIIEHHLHIGTDPCLAGVIDVLIRSGHQAITGNGRT